MPITKPFAICTEGQTIDGRNVSREQIESIAKNYDPKTYTALVNLEHYVSALPDSVFSSYGRVLSVGTQEAVILGEKRLQLMAVAEVSHEAAKLQSEGKKSFASIELQNNFTGKGITYLTGLALTDTPAALGTEPMKFSAFSGGKTGDSLGFKEAVKFEINEPEAEPGLGEKLFASVKTLLSHAGKNTEARFSDHEKAVTALAENVKTLIDKTQPAIDALRQQINTTEATLKTLIEDQTALKTKLTQTAASPARPAATGSKIATQTDC